MNYCSYCGLSGAASSFAYQRTFSNKLAKRVAMYECSECQSATLSAPRFATVEEKAKLCFSRIDAIHGSSLTPLNHNSAYAIATLQRLSNCVALQEALPVLTPPVPVQALECEWPSPSRLTLRDCAREWAGGVWGW